MRQEMEEEGREAEAMAEADQEVHVTTGVQRYVCGEAQLNDSASSTSSNR